MVNENNEVYKEFMGLLYGLFVFLTDNGFYLEGTVDGERDCWLHGMFGDPLWSVGVNWEV